LERLPDAWGGGFLRPQYTASRSNINQGSMIFDLGRHIRLLFKVDEVLISTMHC